MKSSLTILALLGLATQSEITQAIQQQNGALEPGAVTPESNRVIFDKDVKNAEKIVDVQKTTEAENVKVITDIHKKATEETHNKNTVTKAGRQIAIQNELTYGNQNRKLALAQEDPVAAAPAAPANGATVDASKEEKPVP
jgi:hypothetical protein